LLQPTLDPLEQVQVLERLRLRREQPTAKLEIRLRDIDSLKLTAIEKKPEERENPQDLFIHSTIFVVVDKQARLRGVFETEGEGIDPIKARKEILAAVQQLERER